MDKPWCRSLQVNCSDGLDTVPIVKDERVVYVSNGPTPEELERNPNEKGEHDYYVLLANDHPKSQDWRQKLADTLVQAVGSIEDQGVNSQDCLPTGAKFLG